MALLYLTSEQKNEALKPLVLQKKRLENDLFLAKVYKNCRIEIDKKLVSVNKKIEDLKNKLERPLYI